jgi:hypothetical protein
MKIKCLFCGCKYKQTGAETVNGIFIITGKCVICGKKKVLVEEDWENVKNWFTLDASLEVETST